MPVDRVTEQCLVEGETETVLTEEQLDAAICQALWASMGNADPSPASWTRLRRRVLRSQRRGRRGRRVTAQITCG
jgi:hypothetical protein